MTPFKSIQAPKNHRVLTYETNLFDSRTPEERWSSILEQALKELPAADSTLVMLPSAKVTQTSDTKTLCDGPIFGLNASKELVLWIDNPGYGQYQLTEGTKNIDAPCNAASKPDAIVDTPLSQLGNQAVSLQSPLLTLSSLWAKKTKQELKPSTDSFLILVERFDLQEIITLYLFRMLYLNQAGQIFFAPRIKGSSVWPGIRRYCENLGLRICQEKPEKSAEAHIKLSEYAARLEGADLNVLTNEVQSTSEVIPGMLLKKHKL